MGYRKKFDKERDRRYTREDELRSEALRISENARKDALLLATENQRLRDESHNNILNQWRDERANYVREDAYTTRHEAIEKGLRELGTTVTAYVSGQTERAAAKFDSRYVAFTVIGLLIAAAILFSSLH
jgi:hypothetical protein